MENGQPARDKDSLFVWSSGGIRRIRKKIKELLKPKPASASPLSPPGHSEHRRYPRLDLKLPILYKVLGEGASRIPTSVRPYLLAESSNVSPIGLCLSLEEPLPCDTVLALSIHMPEQRQKFSALGRVVWTRPADTPNHFLIGLQFVVVEKDKVREQDHSRMMDWVRLLEEEKAE
jgi:hypothetical protein